MIALLWFVLALLVTPFKSKSRLEAENVVLRQQLIVLRRQMRGRVQLSNDDRLFFVQLYRWFPSILRAVPSANLERLAGNCESGEHSLDDRALQTDLFHPHWAVSVTYLAGSREPGASPPAQYPAAQITEAADPWEHRPADICQAVWLGSRCIERLGNC